MVIKRRNFIKQSALVTGGLLTSQYLTSCASSNKMTKANDGDMFFKLSLAQWSFHKALFSKEFDNLDFAAKTRSMGIDGVEYVNQFFKDKAEDASYLDTMNTRAADANVKQVLIMVDGEGGLGDPKDAERNMAVKKHHKWVHAAKHLGCHSIRVNAFGIGSAEDVGMAAVDGLGLLSEYAAKENINVIVENHGGYSSDGQWLSGVMKKINMKNCGTLPDFGNFCVKREGGKVWGGKCIDEYDRYKGIEELMPYAKAVSAKSNEFGPDGNETKSDFMRIMKIVKDHGYRGFVGIEYEGSKLSEYDGIMATKALLEKVGGVL